MRGPHVKTPMRLSVFFAPVFLILVLQSYSQTERVYLQLNKYSCKTGDTVWFKGYIFRGKYPTSLSTNLYVELFTEQGVLLLRNNFPVIEGVGIGQLIIPDSIITDNYYVRAFTRYQLNYDTDNLFSVPLLVYNKDKPRSVFHKKEIFSINAIGFGIIDGIEWTTTVFEGKLSSMLSIDSASAPRNLHLVKPLTGDSIFIADVMLNGAQWQKYSLLPLDTNKAFETLLLYEDQRLTGRQYLQQKNISPAIKINPDTLDTSPYGYNSWEIAMPDTSIYTTSVSIADADRSISPPITIERLKNSYTDNLVSPISQLDTSFITFSGTATKESGKKIKDPFARDLFIAGTKDSNFVFMRVAHVDDSGHFTLDSLFFFDSLDLQFQINKIEDGSTKNIKLNLIKFIPPKPDSTFFIRNWEDDMTPINKKDTSFTKSELSKYELSKIKTLKPVIVKGWKSHRSELDNKYTTGAFSEPAMYSFDVRTDRRFHDLGSYLRANFSRFRGGFSSFDAPVDVMGHQFLFFVDEQNYTWAELGLFEWEKIAYIKCFENDFIGDDDFVKWKNNMTNGFSLVGNGGLKIPEAKTPVIIAIYMRKGTDFRTMPGGLNKIPVKGYSSILKFNGDAVSLYWSPSAFGNNFRVRFYNSEETKRFRIVIEGMNYKGEIVHLEKIIE